MTEKQALKKIVAAWESLPEGNHSPRVVERWMREKMKPAIDTCRDVLSPQGSEDTSNG